MMTHGKCKDQYVVKALGVYRASYFEYKTLEKLQRSRVPTELNISNTYSLIDCIRKIRDSSKMVAALHTLEISSS